MIFYKTKIKDVYIIEPEFHRDERGYFGRIFCQDELSKVGIDFIVRQASQGLSLKKGMIHGIHFQREPAAEKKIVQCIRGAIYDVVVDLRKDSETYGQWIAEELSEENKKKIYIPEGCAHGFQTLVDNSERLYLMSEFYSSKHCDGLRWDDPSLKITWPIQDSVVISEKDRQWPLL